MMPVKSDALLGSCLIERLTANVKEYWVSSYILIPYEGNIL